MHRGSSIRRALAAGLLGVAALAPATPARATNDSHWSLQWGPRTIRVESPWAAGVDGSGVKIGIVDSGVDLDHGDLRGKVAPGDAIACIGTGGDHGKCSGSGEDVDGHGTHVAGIAAAHKDNGEGIAGVAPGAGLVVARVFDGNTARSADVNAGIKWVVDRGARVVNLSVEGLLPVGEFFGSDELRPGIEYAWRAGAVAVLSAGNTNIAGLGSANYGRLEAVVVGATGRDDRPAGYSSPTGDAQWAMMAPGGTGGSSGIYSTLPAGRYGYLSGTSMAAPHVAGALALLLSRDPSAVKAVDTLRGSAVNRSSACGPNSPTCAGRLDVCAIGRCGSTTSAATADPAPDGRQVPVASGTAPTADSPSTSGENSGGDAHAGARGDTASAPAAGPTKGVGSRAAGSRFPAPAGRIGPPSPSATAAPAAPAEPAAGVPEELGAALNRLGTGNGGETATEPLTSLELAEPARADRRPGRALFAAAIGLLIPVALAGAGLHRRQLRR